MRSVKDWKLGFSRTRYLKYVPEISRRFFGAKCSSWSICSFGVLGFPTKKANNKQIEKTQKISSFLKSVYGEEIFNDKVDKLSKSEFKDLCENLQNGIAISTPVFDGAKEKNVTEMLELANLPGSGQTLSLIHI